MKIKMHLNGVTRGAGMGRDNRRVTLRQPVEQGRLAGIRQPGDSDDESVAQALPSPRLRDRARNLVAQLFRGTQRGAEKVFRNVGLIGEVNPRLDEGERGDNLLTPRLGTIANQPLELTKRLPALRRGLGRNQIRQAFDGGEIEPAVVEGAAGEFAGLGRAAAVDGRQCVKHGGNDAHDCRCSCSSAMSSPVSLSGPGNQSASASSITSPLTGSRTRPSVACRGFGARPRSFSSGAPARGPHPRTTAIAAGGRPEERA